jgi:cyclophilin family peptidyl-prolyl cis-trans isomerase
MKNWIAGCLMTLAAVAAAEDPQVIMRTSHGDITLRLFAEKAPITVENFLDYVDSGFYNDTIFHRVIPNFMIQGGGMTARMEEKPTRDPIRNEARNRLHNQRGTIAMARTNDPDSATSQFFINVRNNFRLDWSPGSAGYTVFGEVVDGMFVVDSIAIEPTGPMMGHGDVPQTPVIIREVVRVGAETPVEAADEESTAEPAQSE